MTSRFLRRPTPSELGCDVTIAIAAITIPDGDIVTVSDRMISYDDIAQAEEHAGFKNRQLTPYFGLMFSATNAALFRPILQNATSRLIAKGLRHSLTCVKQEVCAAYNDIFDREFSGHFLSRLKISNIEEFRQHGLKELGSDVFMDIYRELSRFDLGIQLICYGFDEEDKSYLFEVNNPGHAIDHDRYAVTGSGYWMALASLRRKRLFFHLESTIYRLLEAKFSAETATGVGRPTLLITMNSEGKIGFMHEQDIDQIRAIWDGTLKFPDPHDALTLIKQSSAVTTIKLTG
jgi:hypothetical protein